MTTTETTQEQPDFISPEEAGVLVTQQRARMFCIKMQRRVTQATNQYIVSLMDHSRELKELNRKEKFSVAERIRAHIEKHGEIGGMSGVIAGDDLFGHALGVSINLIMQSAMSRAPYDAMREEEEERMEHVIGNFAPPAVRTFIENTAGFGWKGAAIIIGEAGYPPNYGTVSRFWKRLGMAVIDGERQQRKAGLTQEEVLRIGYKPARRAEMWALADSCYKHQVGKHADTCQCNRCTTGSATAALDTGAIPVFQAKGKYGLDFIRAYNTFRERGKTHGHAYNHGRRIMWKAILRDFWVAWRDQTSFEAQAKYVPPALEGGGVQKIFDAQKTHNASSDSKPKKATKKTAKKTVKNSRKG
jgi:hypothetical protein